MKLFRFLVLLSCGLVAFNNMVVAQDDLLAYQATDSPAYLAPPSITIQEYYNEHIAKYGPNDRYRAAELALQKYGCQQDEYAAKLYNLLAEEAVLMQNYEQAAIHYNKVLTTTFNANYYAGGLLAERAQLDALAGLRNIAMQEQEYAEALQYHKRYVDSLQMNWGDLAHRNKLKNDKIFATCYQSMGQSEKAIAYLMPYAFGAVAGTYGYVDKEAIDHLTELLRTKYPKKEYKRFLNTVATQIYSEKKEGRVLFYLQVLENRIYFQNDSANYEQRAAQDETLVGQGVAHYQRKFLNSYFYQRLFK